MYINITDSETGNNKGSCGALVQYLEKENLTTLPQDRKPELWFNGTYRDITLQQVKVSIDNNIAKLGNEDAKFFLINISPSQKEILYLKEQFGEAGAAEKLKEYAAKVMDTYARNFKRNGVNNNHNLLWYGKLEQHRYYSSHDKEVKEGLEKAGQPKDGEQMHVQIIVSRKDITNKIKLSPMNNSRGKNERHSAKLGQFDRTAFKESAEVIFDKTFSYNRQVKDTMAYALTMKKGSAEQKHLLYTMEYNERHIDENKLAYSDVTKDVFPGGSAQELELLLNTGSSIVGGLMDIFPAYQDYQQYENISLEQKKKKKRRRPKL